MENSPKSPERSFAEFSDESSPKSPVENSEKNPEENSEENAEDSAEENSEKSHRNFDEMSEEEDDGAVEVLESDGNFGENSKKEDSDVDGDEGNENDHDNNEDVSAIISHDNFIKNHVWSRNSSLRFFHIQPRLLLCMRFYSTETHLCAK